MGLIYGGVPWGMQHGLDRGNGIDLREHAIGIWHWLGHVIWGRDWIREMGLICGGTPRGVRHWLDVNYEIDLWGYCMGRATGSGRWNWFVEANHGGVWHWLDLGEGLIYVGASWGRMTMAGLGLWDWFMVACRMAKYYMVAECKWQSSIWLLCKWRYHVSYVWLRVW